MFSFLEPIVKELCSRCPERGRTGDDLDGDASCMKTTGIPATQRGWLRESRVIRMKAVT